MNDLMSQMLVQLCGEIQKWFSPTVVLVGEIIGAVHALHPDEERHVATSVERRRAEFAAGRWCAREALRQLGLSGTPAISMGRWREPIWPPGFVGSITHDGGLCLVAIAPARDHLGIGIDLIDCRRGIHPGLMELIATPHEAERLAVLSNDPAEAFIMLFCAKESIIKIQSPQLQRLVEMKEIELQFDKTQFSAVHTDIGEVVYGRWFRQGHFLAAATQYRHFDRNTATG